MTKNDTGNDAATADRDRVVGELLAHAETSGLTALTERDSKDILARFGVSVPRGIFVDMGILPDELGALISALKPPYVLKALANDVLHKSELGAVQLGIHSASELAAAMEAMRDRLGAQGVIPTGFLVEETAPAGTELIIGGQYRSAVWSHFDGRYRRHFRRDLQGCRLSHLPDRPSRCAAIC